MFKKNKQLIIGFILGALVFSIVPVGATVQEYILKKSETKLMVDGKEFTNKELPVLVYKGYNYIPAATFREITDTLGVGFEYVGERKEIQIITNKNDMLDKVQLKDNIEREKVDKMERIAKDGFELFIVNGIEHISLGEVKGYLKEQQLSYDIHYNPQNKEFQFQKIINEEDPTSNIILLDDIPTRILYDRGVVTYDYYKQNILSLIK